MPLVVPSLTACGLQRGRRVGTPGLQPGLMVPEVHFWFYLLLPVDSGGAGGRQTGVGRCDVSVGGLPGGGSGGNGGSGWDGSSGRRLSLGQFH